MGTFFTPIGDANALKHAVVLGQSHETRLLEFKTEYAWERARHRPEDLAGQAEELCRDVAQFANTEGGTVLVGITERLADNGQRVADRILGVENVDGLKQWAEQAIRNHLTPSTFSRSLDTILVSEGVVVLALNVPPALHLVALWHPDRKKGIEYLYRTDHGKQWMNPDEVERHLMNASRAMQIQLARVVNEVTRPGGNVQVELTPPVKAWVESGFHPLGTLVSANYPVFLHERLSSEHEIEVRINVDNRLLSVRIPHGLISEAWTTSDRRVGLCLKVAVVVRGPTDVGLEPLVSALPTS